MQSYRIGIVSEFEEGTKKVFNLGKTEVGVFRLGGENSMPGTIFVHTKEDPSVKAGYIRAFTKT